MHYRILYAYASLLSNLIIPQNQQEKKQISNCIFKKKNVSKITLKKGKTAQITVKEIKKDKKIRHHRNLCYESSNTAVATVTPEGLIQAVGKGTCTIWVYAQNGVYAALTVTVK